MITLTDEQLVRLLIGSEISISVGEPWDFASSDGQGVLKGRIVEVDPGEAGQPLSQTLKLLVTPFEVEGLEGGYTVEYLTARGRYAGEQGMIERIASGEDVDANLGYEDQVPEEYSAEGVSPFLIGGVILSEWQEPGA